MVSVVVVVAVVFVAVMIYVGQVVVAWRRKNDGHRLSKSKGKKWELNVTTQETCVNL